MKPAWHKNLWFWAAVILTVAKLWLLRGQWIYAIGNAKHDDRLFLELTAHILQGEWLGPYDQLTLAKGPLYSLFIAGTFLAGLPLAFAQQLLYLGAGVLVLRAARPILTSSRAYFFAYTLLLVNPLTYEGESMTRLLRQHLLVPLGLMVAAGLIALLLRRTASLRSRLPWTILLGLALGGVWLTREETIWIFSIIIIIGSKIMIDAWRDGAAARRAMAWLASIAATGFLLPLLIICTLNLHYYGWFGTVEFRSSDFKDAYGALTRVQVGPMYPNVPVSRQAREAIYQVSPAFAELRTYFEGPDHPWADREFFKPAEPQILGGWFMWALRDAVAHAGHATSAKEALDFYRRIATEVNRACNDGRIPAGPPHSGFLPPWRPAYTAGLINQFSAHFSYFTYLDHFTTRPPYSIGTDDELRLFRDLTRDEISPSLTAIFIEQPKRDQLNLRKLEWLQRIGRPISAVMYYITLLALAATALRLGQCLWQRRMPNTLWLALGMWAAFMGAFAVNLLVQVTSFINQYPAVVAAAYSFLPLFIVFVALDLNAAWGPIFRRALGPSLRFTAEAKSDLRHWGWTFFTTSLLLIVSWLLRNLGGTTAGLSTAAVFILLMGLRLAWPQATPTLTSNRRSGWALALLSLSLGGLTFFWSSPLEFNRDQRWKNILRPAGTLLDLKFHFTTASALPDGRLMGAAGIPSENLRNIFYGTHVEGPQTITNIQSDPITITGPYLVVPIAGFPQAAGNALILRIEDVSGAMLQEITCPTPNPRDLSFWQIDVRAYPFQSAKLILHDQRTQNEGWVAVAPPHFTSNEQEAAQRERHWQLEQWTAARLILLALALVTFGWSGLPSRRADRP